MGKWKIATIGLDIPDRFKGSTLMGYFSTDGISPLYKKLVDFLNENDVVEYKIIAEDVGILTILYRSELQDFEYVQADNMTEEELDESIDATLADTSKNA